MHSAQQKMDAPRHENEANKNFKNLRNIPLFYCIFNLKFFSENYAEKYSKKANFKKMISKKMRQLQKMKFQKNFECKSICFFP